MTLTAAAALFGFVLGAVVGSFLATLILRWPTGRSVAAGRSRCDGCGRKLAAHQLIPLVSGTLQRGKCTACGAPIDPVHWQVEGLAALAGALSLAVSPDLVGLALAVFAWLLIPLAMLDWRHLWLPDRLILVLAVAGAAGGQMLGVPWRSQLIGAAVGFASLGIIGAAYAAIRKRQGLGGGDPKLLGAIGIWIGWESMAPLVALAAAMGLAVALATGRQAGDQLAFGTMLAAAAWPIALLLAG